MVRHWASCRCPNPGNVQSWVEQKPQATWSLPMSGVVGNRCFIAYIPIPEHFMTLFFFYFTESVSLYKILFSFYNFPFNFMIEAVMHLGKCKVKLLLLSVKSFRYSQVFSVLLFLRFWRVFLFGWVFLKLQELNI